MECDTPENSDKSDHSSANGPLGVSSMADKAKDGDKENGQTGVSAEGSLHTRGTKNSQGKKDGSRRDNCKNNDCKKAGQCKPNSQTHDGHGTELADLLPVGAAPDTNSFADQQYSSRTEQEDDNESTASDCTCFCSCCCGICSEETEPKNKRLVFRWYDVPLSLAAAALYLSDVYTDLRLALQFLLDGHLRYGCVTLSFVMLAYVVSVGYGVKEYVRLRRQKNDTYAAPATVWAVRLLLTVLMLGPIVNTVEYIYNGCKSRRKRCRDREKYVCRMKNHHMNNAFLRLFEACLEAAPQLVFQLYVMVVTKPHIEGVEGVWRVLTVVTSWLSLAHTLTAFTKSRRNSSDDGCFCHQPATVRHQAFDFLWRLAETGGRVLCIALFTSVFKFWLLAVLIPHGLIMAAWQYLQERDGSVISLLEYFVYAYVFQFCFINNYSGGYARIQYLVFYLLFYAESFTMLGLWYCFTPDQGEWFHLWGLVAGLASLPLHVFLQLFYYKCCHPNSHNIKAVAIGDRATWKQHLIGPFSPRQSA